MENENKIAIRVDHVSKVYKLYDNPTDRLKESLGFGRKNRHRDFHALRDISFDVCRGETVGIIGTNGSGKSTILKIITGVLNPTSGNVQVNGRISALLELGAGFNSEYTGMENIYLQGTMIGFTREEVDRRLSEIVSFADIGDFIYQPVKTYSSGMFVRLAFAVAINIDPEILIVDEALSVGDVFFQAKCYHKFEEFKKAGKTILFVSHDLGSIGKYCDRVVLLNRGDKVAEGAPKEMVDLYKRFLVHQEGDQKSTALEMSEGAVWKEGLNLNPNLSEYGEKQAEIVDFGIFDEDGRLNQTIEKGSKCTFKMKIHFIGVLTEPIIAFTIKDLKGTEVTGTNTMYEKVLVPSKQGSTVTVSFTQPMDLQGGEYLISFGCTGYLEGDFRVFHRIYDACNITVVSVKNTVGFYDMNSEIEVTKES